MMGVYDLHRRAVPPEVPCRKKDDVLEILMRWEDGPYVEEADFDENPEVDWDQLEQDIHALAHIAMQHLPD